MKITGRRGMAFTPKIVQQYATRLAGALVSSSWVKRFTARHADDLKVRWTTTLEAFRTRALNRTVVREYFDIIWELIEKYHIPPENIYNMNEKGNMLGLGKRRRVCR